MTSPTDLTLAVLVDALDSTQPGTGLSVTLVVGGAVISGSIVSRETWAASSRDALASAGTHGENLAKAPAYLEETWREMREAAAKEAANEDGADESETGELENVPDYIHLVPAYVIAGGEHPTRLPAGIRVRLDQVHAWAYGRANF